MKVVHVNRHKGYQRPQNTWYETIFVESSMWQPLSPVRKCVWPGWWWWLQQRKNTCIPQPLIVDYLLVSMATDIRRHPLPLRRPIHRRQPTNQCRPIRGNSMGDVCANYCRSNWRSHRSLTLCRPWCAPFWKLTIVQNKIKEGIFEGAIHEEKQQQLENNKSITMHKQWFNWLRVISHPHRIVDSTMICTANRFRMQHVHHNNLNREKSHTHCKRNVCRSMYVIVVVHGKR